MRRRARIGFAIAIAIAATALLMGWQTGAFDRWWSGGRADPANGDAVNLRAGREGAAPVLNTAPALDTGAGRTPSAGPIAVAVVGPRVTGRVVDGAGRGIAAARVLSIPDTNGKTFALTDLGKEGCPAFDTIADAEGRFVVAVSKDAPFHLIVAEAPGFGIAGKADVPIGGEVIVTLAPSRTLSGTVRDSDGNAVRGARLRALLLVDTLMLERQATSDASGSYRMESLPAEHAPKPGGWIGYLEGAWFEIVADGYAPLFVEHVLREATGREPRKDFTLSRGSVLMGRVEDADTGSPLAGATVRLGSTQGTQGYTKQSGGNFMNPYSPRTLATTTTGSDGSFQIEHIPSKRPSSPGSRASGPGARTSLGVAAWADGYAAAGDYVGVADEGAVVEVTLKLWPAGQVTGRVLDGARRPVAGASVGVSVEGRDFKSGGARTADEAARAWTKTTEDGRFTIRGAPASRTGPTEAKVSVYAPPARRQTADPAPSVRVVPIKPGEPLDVGDIVLHMDDGKGTIWETTTLLVTTPDGRPYFGATVGQRAFDSGKRTDAEGKVEWPWPKAKEGQTLETVRLVVSAPGWAPTPATLHPPGSGKESIVIALDRARRVAGRVLLADGTPGAQVRVLAGDAGMAPEDVFPEGGGEALMEMQQVPKGRLLPAIYGQAWTEGDGTFAFESLPDGPYHLRATKARRVPVGPGGTPLVVIARNVAADTSDVILRLPSDDSPATGNLVGRVAESGTGKPVQGAWVRVHRGADVLAFVRGPGGTVPSAPGTPSFLDAAGQFRIENLPVGPVAVEVGAPEFRPSRIAAIEVKAEAVVDVGAIALDHGIAVVGRLQPPAGASLKDRTLTFRDLEAVPNPRYLAATLTADGSFRATGFEPGRYTAVAQGPFPGSEKLPVLVPARGESLLVTEGATEVRFDVEWVQAGTLYLAPDDDRLPQTPWSGEVATQEQKRFGAATRIRVTNADGAVFLDLTGVSRSDLGANGWLALVPGRYTARIEFPGGEVREEQIDLKAGAEVGVRFGQK
jgi:hypothetical protein